jgi:hypothetical protein
MYTCDTKKEDTLVWCLLINLNLIVDRPDGLIKEGKRSFFRTYFMSSGK